MLTGTKRVVVTAGVVGLLACTCMYLVLPTSHGGALWHPVFGEKMDVRGGDPCWETDMEMHHACREPTPDYVCTGDECEDDEDGNPQCELSAGEEKLMNGWRDHCVSVEATGYADCDKPPFPQNYPACIRTVTCSGCEQKYPSQEELCKFDRNRYSDRVPDYIGRGGSCSQ